MKKENAMTEVKPLYDKVLIRRDKAPETNEAGLIIPAMAKDRPTTGTVVSVGCGRINDNGESIPLVISAGNRVMFSDYAGNEISVNGETLLIMSECEIFAVVQDRK